jgi:hypothetical protein
MSTTHLGRWAAVGAVLIVMGTSPLVAACGASNDSPTFTDLSETWQSSTPSSQTSDDEMPTSPDEAP